MSIYIGIEGVGIRNSVAVACNEAGEILSVEKEEAISLHTIQRARLRSIIKKLLDRVLGEINHPVDDLSDVSLCIGLQGVTFPYDAQVDLPREIAQMEYGKFKNLICTGDVEIIFASHAQTDQGSAIVCGCGSTAYLIDKHKRRRFGGWGPALGDEGSAYRMGLAALRVIVEQYDREKEDKGAKQILWHEIATWLSSPYGQRGTNIWKKASLNWKKYLRDFKEFDMRTALFAFSHEMALKPDGLWRVIASGLAIPLMRAWENGDNEAAEIVLNAINELVKQYEKDCAFAEREGISVENKPLVLYGGVIEHNQSFRKKLVEQLSVSHERNIILPEASGTMRPACGAALFALGESKTGELKLPRNSQIKERLLKEYERDRFKKKFQSD